MFAGAARFATPRSPHPLPCWILSSPNCPTWAAYAITTKTIPATFCPLPRPRAARTAGFSRVADGVGGEERGEVASQTAIETLIAGFEPRPKGEAHTVLMPRLVQTANTRIYELGKAASPGGSRMATTIVACAFRYDRVVVAHVGDSRCYLIRHGLASQITRDHTVVAEQVRLGLLSPREAAEAETRHLLSRSLGNDLFVNVEIGDRQVQVDDVLLLCSDGLHGPVEGREMGEIVRWNPDLEYRRAQN